MNNISVIKFIVELKKVTFSYFNIYNIIEAKEGCSMKVGIYTLGCKVNMYESEFVIDQLKRNNYEIADFTDICDVYIINTCTVTNTSDTKSKKMIRSAIRRNKDACIVVMGCFTEANQDYQEDGVDIYLGTKDKSRIIPLLEEYFENKKTIRNLTSTEQKKFEDMFITKFEGRTRAFVKIQDGCRNFCSYCIIPYVRGGCRSKDKEKVIEEVKQLTANGYQEIVLTGIHTGNYGVDLKTNFASLLRELIQIKALKRLRISSIEVTELNNDVLAILKESSIIVDHLHIPLQAGCNNTLKRMNRKYDLDFFKKKIAEIRAIRPDISISTDIIVGFPGETDEDFRKTLTTSREIAFSKIHVFPYSIRKNTKAATMNNQIDSVEKKRRAQELIALSKELELNYMGKFLGQTLEVLTENSHDGATYAHTGNFLHVKINKVIPNDTLLNVKISALSYPYVIGEIDE